MRVFLVGVVCLIVAVCVVLVVWLLSVAIRLVWPFPLCFLVVCLLSRRAGCWSALFDA